MNVIVLGCGRIGSRLATILDESGVTVAIVDREEDSFRRLVDGFSGRTVVGNVISRSVLEEAGVAEADAVAAVTSGDNSNIVAARMARETYGIESVVARIKDPKRAEVYRRLGIPTVATVTWTVDHVMRKLLRDQTVTEWSHPTGALHLVERALPSDWAGQRLDPLLGESTSYQLVVVTRAGGPQLAGPGLIGQEGDVLHLLVEDAARDELEAALGRGAGH